MVKDRHSDVGCQGCQSDVHEVRYEQDLHAVKVRSEDGCQSDDGGADRNGSGERETGSADLVLD